MSAPAEPDALSTRARFAAPLPLFSMVGFAGAVIVVVLIAFFSYRALQSRASSADLVSHTIQVMERLQSLMSSLKDAETGQRGYLITGTEQYLEPYNDARASIAGQIAFLRTLLADNPVQAQRLDAIGRVAADKLAEAERTIALRRAGEAEKALALVRSDQGRAAMDRIRASITEMTGEERDLLATRQADWQDAVVLSYRVIWGGSLVLLFLIGAGAVFASRDHRAREAQIWLRAGLAGLATRIAGEQRLDVLGEKVLTYAAGYLDAHVGAIYVVQEDGQLRRFAGYGTPVGEPPERIAPGESLLGQAAKEGRTLHVTQVPAGYLAVNSTVGRALPRELLIAPARVDGRVQAVVELGFFRRLYGPDRELMERLCEALGVAVRSAKDRTRLEALLEETQRQSEELQAQQEELRVSNEELEEQGRALKESQAQLEAQQTDLVQSNAQLEEQAQQLEAQRDDLARAQAALTTKADELERSNQYKSEFLANMSHELRTPLNSTLILAKLLADNKDGNLSAEQVKFAQTISSAGNDLLTLINDILDLSKIEAGQVTVHAETVALAALAEELDAAMRPLADDRGLGFEASIEPGTPAEMLTDPQRLAQILKNLLSNALKFTERGRVALRIFEGAPGEIRFAVSDTGVGIEPHQHALIFEAFRQADGSTHRKFGGTGLGLSISRDLARLLGGDIVVRSAPGEGSEFTLHLPVAYARPDAVAARERPMPPAPPAPRPARTLESAIAATARTAASPPAAPLDDDRERLASEGKVVLVIEDDPRFAAILRDLAREMGFGCVIAASAGEGLDAAARYVPSAILLDMNLPDHSGLGVLDQLKRNPQTRHIPVHVLSVLDYSQEARELGAVGYDLKPVKRAQIADALRKLEATFSQRLRRVLVVEDDERQRESIGHLLASDDVQIVAVDRAVDALEQLRSATFDCMIMDLNLPDLSGYDLLERMATLEDASFPPVIVYTGRTLGADEEQRLRRFSRSIIIKDARSPERLLDEVTLFLHKVESTLPPALQQMLRSARDRDSALDGRRILVVEDDVRNIFALTSVLEPKGAKIQLARNGREALEALELSQARPEDAIDLVLMDIMMPEMDGFEAMRRIRREPQWARLPIVALTAKAMKDDQEKCLAAGANDYIAKPLDPEKLLSLIRVWMPR